MKSNTYRISAGGAGMSRYSSPGQEGDGSKSWTPNTADVRPSKYQNTDRTQKEKTEKLGSEKTMGIIETPRVITRRWASLGLRG
jgi:hypothetical protein